MSTVTEPSPLPSPNPYLLSPPPRRPRTPRVSIKALELVSKNSVLVNNLNNDDYGENVEHVDTHEEVSYVTKEMIEESISIAPPGAIPVMWADIIDNSLVIMHVYHDRVDEKVLPGLDTMLFLLSLSFNVWKLYHHEIIYLSTFYGVVANNPYIYSALNHLEKRRLAYAFHIMELVGATCMQYGDNNFTVCVWDHVTKKTHHVRPEDVGLPAELWYFSFCHDFHFFKGEPSVEHIAFMRAKQLEREQQQLSPSL